MEAAVRTSGRRRDERADAALIDAVLDLVSGGATLSGLSLVTIAKTARGLPQLALPAVEDQGRPLPGRLGIDQPGPARPGRPQRL